MYLVWFFHLENRGKSCDGLCGIFEPICWGLSSQSRGRFVGFLGSAD